MGKYYRYYGHNNACSYKKEIVIIYINKYERNKNK